MSNPSSRTEFVLSTDGKIIKRQIMESAKELTADQLTSLATQETRFWPAIFTHENAGPVTLGILKETLALSAELPSIRIRTNYTLSNGVLVPDFNRKGEPIFDIHWSVPADMKVLFGVEIGNKNILINAYILAFDEEKRCYRLPLGNLYENANICLGEFTFNPVSAQAQFNAAFEQFNKSVWNDDLANSGDAEKTRSLFRFKPKDDGFEQLPSTAKWQESCKIIAPPILKFIKI
jgi:hypothetical protein